MQGSCIKENLWHLVLKMPICVKSVCPEKWNFHLSRKFSCLPKYR